jgi:hypothetical protein
MKNPFAHLPPEAWKKTRKVYICQTDGMALWMGLQSSFKQIEREIGHPRANKPIEPFPTKYPINPKCRCRDCRWHRIFHQRR